LKDPGPFYPLLAALFKRQLFLPDGAHHLLTFSLGLSTSLANRGTILLWQLSSGDEFSPPYLKPALLLLLLISLRRGRSVLRIASSAFFPVSVTGSAFHLAYIFFAVDSAG